jgi:hypothetical protein
MSGARTEDESLGDLDLGSELEAISNELFGQDSEETEEGDLPKEGEETPETPTPSEASPPEKPAEEKPAEEKPTEENSPQVQQIGAPKTWSKEALEKWATIDPLVQKEIAKREEDIHRGIEQYKARAEVGDRFTEVTKPYAEILQREGVDPVQLFQAFSANHFILTSGTPEQKLNVAAMLMKSYGIDPDQVKALLANQPAPAAPAALPPEADQRIKALEQARYEEQRAALAEQVQAFAADPKNIYFKDVSSDMATLLKTGVASTLQQAYDMAVYNNPDTRQKELDRLTAERMEAERKAEAERLEQARQAQGANVKSKPKNKSGTAPVLSMEETLEETYREIAARG